MKNFDFAYNFDFSNLNAVELNKKKILHKEIIAVFENKNSCWYNLDGFDSDKYFIKIIGFSSTFRFLLLALNFIEDRVIFHQIEIANEDDFRHEYCSK